MFKSTKKFVDESSTTHRPGDKYKNVIKRISDDGVCPFCPEYIKKYHKNPIIKSGRYWALTNNMYPYEGAKYHMLLIHKKHIENIADVSKGAWAELQSMMNAFVKTKRIKGGSFLMRFGETSHTGASVTHLHANLVSPDGEDKNRKPIITRIA